MILLSNHTVLSLVTAHQLQQDEILLIAKGVAYKTSFTNEWVQLVITECLHQSIYLSFDKLIRTCTTIITSSLVLHQSDYELWYSMLNCYRRV